MEFMSNPVVFFEAQWFFVWSVCHSILNSAVIFLGLLWGIICGTILFFIILDMYTRFDPIFGRTRDTRRRAIHVHERLVNYEKNLVF